MRYFDNSGSGPNQRPAIRPDGVFNVDDTVGLFGSIKRESTSLLFFGCETPVIKLSPS
jgi:hypothetical protein